MSRLDDTTPKFQQLLSAVCDDATQEDLSALESMAQDDATMRLLVDYLQLDAELHRSMRGESGVETCLSALGIESPRRPSRDVFADEGETVHVAEMPSPTNEVTGAWRGLTGLFHVGGLPFSYAVGALVCGIAVWIASLVTISYSTSRVASEATADAKAATPKIVGRITGMVDCRWVDPRTEPLAFAYVPLGRTFALASGLMEITYDSGAKVVLQGPCAFVAESTRGGYLSRGKLAARVGATNKEVGGRETSCGEKNLGLLGGTPKTTSVDPHPAVANPSSPAPRLPISECFAIRTPTARVTDLGTEFGVEVLRGGETLSRVFVGEVELRPVDHVAVRNSASSDDSRAIRLRANQSARVERRTDGTTTVVRFAGQRSQKTATEGDFVRVDQFRAIRAESMAVAKAADAGRAAASGEVLFQRWQLFRDRLRNDPDLVAYYDFQPEPGDRGVLHNRAATGRQFDGRIQNAGWTEGRLPGQSALQFGRLNSGVRVNIPVELEQLTVAAWVRIDESGNNNLLLSDGQPRPGQVVWLVSEEGQVFFGTMGAQGQGRGGFSPVAIVKNQLGRWCFLAVAYDHRGAEKVTFYLNGAIISHAVLDVPHPAPTNLGQATLGGWSDRPGAPSDAEYVLHGRMGELMLFRTAFSPEEVRRLYHGILPIDRNAVKARGKEM